MRRFRISKFGLIVIALIVVVIMLIIASATGSQRRNISGLESGARDAAAPLESGTTSLIDKVSGLPGRFVDLDELQAENKQLKAQVADLEAQVNNLEEAKTENIYLRELLNLSQEMSDWNPTSAAVIGRSSKNWYKTLTIKGGTNVGFAKNMPVMTQDGLIGRINSVSNTTSQVLLLTDQECAVSAMVQPSQTPGVVEGNGQNNDTLTMIHIPADAKIKTGQSVITSGLGGIFPAGLRIGYISEVRSTQGNLMLAASIDPYVDFDRITTVLVLKSVPVEDLPVEDNEEGGMTDTGEKPENTADTDNPDDSSEPDAGGEEGAE